MKPAFDPKHFAARIRIAMAKLDIDQKAAAKQIGVTESTVSRACRGHGAAPNLENYLRIERWLKKHSEIDTATKRLAALRGNHSYTDAARTTGLSAHTIRRLENGELTLRLNHAVKIAKAYGVTVAYLIGESEAA